MKKIVKIVAFQGNSGNSGGDGVLNSNQRGTGRGKTAGDLRERVPRVPRGIPMCEFMSFHPDKQLFLSCRCRDRTTDQWITRPVLYPYTSGTHSAHNL